MLAFLSVWLGLAALAYAAAIVAWRPLFGDVHVTASLYAAIFSLTFAGLALWSLRRLAPDEPGVGGQRTQAWVGTALSIAAIVVIYLLIARADVVPRSSRAHERIKPDAMLCEMNAEGGSRTHTSLRRPDFESGADTQKTPENIGVSQTPPPVAPPVGGGNAAADPTLARLVEAWPALPAAIRAGIIAMVEAAGGKG